MHHDGSIEHFYQDANLPCTALTEVDPKPSCGRSVSDGGTEGEASFVSAISRGSSLGSVSDILTLSGPETSESVSLECDNELEGRAGGWQESLLKRHASGVGLSWLWRRLSSDGEDGTFASPSPAVMDSCGLPTERRDSNYVAEPTAGPSASVVGLAQGGRAGEERPALAVATALSHGIRLAALQTSKSSGKPESVEDRYSGRRQLDILCGDVTFEWEERAPEVFGEIRNWFGIKHEDYVASMSVLQGGVVGEGKSGACFFRSQDGRFIVKTISERELQCLQRSVKDYADVMSERRNSTLLPRFFGAYTVKLAGAGVLRLLVMNRLWYVPSCLRVVERFDIKGSKLKRKVTTTEHESNQTATLKDLNFCCRHDGTDDNGQAVKGESGPCRCVHLGDPRRQELLLNIARDVQWLREHNIIDYSLLLGVCTVRAPSSSLHEALQSLREAAKTEDDRHRLLSLWCPCDAAVQRAESTTDGALESGDTDAAVGAEGDDSGRCYILGIVDTLQEYNIKRRAETLLKTGLYSAEGTNPAGLTVVNPERYMDRFLRFVEAHVK